MPTPPDGVDVITILRHATRGGTAAAWVTANPVLAPREEGIETDTMRRKVGDGSTHYVDLPYWGDDEFHWHQGTISNVWTIPHPGRTIHNWMVYDSAGDQAIGSVAASPGVTVITFTGGSFSGDAYGI